jgi:hypothetical protein
MQRLTDTDLSNRDVSGAKQSFSELTEFLTRFLIVNMRNLCKTKKCLFKKYDSQK